MNILLDYCRANIEDFDFLESQALQKIDDMRCPLQMACPELYEAMSDAIEEWGNDNGVDVSEVDIEEVFWDNE